MRLWRDRLLPHRRIFDAELLQVRVESRGIVVEGLHQGSVALHDLLVEEDGWLVGVRNEGDVLLLLALDVIEVGPCFFHELGPEKKIQERERLYLRTGQAALVRDRCGHRDSVGPVVPGATRHVCGIT